MMKKIGIGLLSGIITGLFATGGGNILVPALVYLIGLTEKQARATAIACVLPAVIISFIFYYQNDYIDIKMGILAAIGGIIGAFIGEKLLNRLSDKVLRIGYTLFLMYVSIKFMF